MLSVFRLAAGDLGVVPLHELGASLARPGAVAPALRDGKPVPAPFLQPFDFRPPAEPAGTAGATP